MKINYKKVAFVVLDVVILGFFGLYLALNVKYRDEMETADFTIQRLLDNTTKNETPSTPVACSSIGNSSSCSGTYSSGSSCTSTVSYNSSTCTKPS